MVCSREIPGDAKSPFVDHVFMCCYYEDWEPCRQVKKKGQQSTEAFIIIIFVVCKRTSYYYNTKGVNFVH